MLNKVIHFSIKNKFVIGLFTLGLIVWGIYSATRLPIDALPDITNNQVQIITTSPTLATQEVEKFITYPIEREVKSIPNIVELRSVSRFGLSLITVVFEEDVDIYWARNQITERIKAAEQNIPPGLGTPELAPVSTGLGEIYQYVVSAEKGYEDKYDEMELRTIQDWIIVPQLLGTKGVAEVNTLGGRLKEYEVAVDPDKLKSMAVTMAEIFEALEVNNENTGGAYIDKKPSAYYIRGVGMVKELDEINKIVVKVENGLPILIRDVATVQFGNAIRYGATTKDGKGEVVSGMVMMLKGANSAEVVFRVKEKVEVIKETLPEGVTIEPFLDRSKLVNNAISTVEKNLIEGALIVIFILVLLIGNWRAGLIVASVIPLALLFAISLMNLFGVSGNLMSLGAIDFGLIVDGAVIIVEAIIHTLHKRTSGKTLTAEEMDEEVYQASSKIRTSAAFGEIIILIVYLPILVLVGIEGKMFGPMAQTVSFAILGAFLLSLTYVPMMSALFLSKQVKKKKTISDKIINFLNHYYQKLLGFAFKIKGGIIAVSLLLFIGALALFNSLGGEFIPTLEEGDIATHVIIPPGSSLEQEIETTTKAEQLLMANFPEVEQVVSKIGSAEVPTDPMPMEVADVMVILKPKSEWTSAKTKEELMQKMEGVLDDLPGVTTEFTQPIQMRFNELMTGVRSDVGIKVFGEDIDMLVGFGDEIVSIVQGVEGVVDARAETIAGLPQISVNYDKDKLALYGLNVGDLNQLVRMGFAGEKAGVVYEGEKRFDLVVRLAEEDRQDMDDLKNMYVTLPSGSQIPLAQVADITMERGPAQISREQGKRRIIIGFNVRERDVQSVVKEIQDKLKSSLDLPVGYYVEYAGQFENLVEANKRLSIAVPIALVFILALLYITFKSLPQALLIFTAIPLAAIGGVVALWMRDMPFSISAGVGFIALFGVAVLNGIVLIGYFNQLKAEGMTDIVARIKEGTKVRLRPVIMTAAVASLGFLPMAMSNSAGAEVQKPLATVVMGGLLTATFLTLIVLPILYYYLEKGFKIKSNGAKTIALFLIGFISINSMAQVEIKNLDEAIELGLTNNHQIKIAALNVQRQTELKGTAYDVPKTDLGATYGQINTASFDQSYSISQQFNPALYVAKKKYLATGIAASKIEELMAQQEVRYQIQLAWNEAAYHHSMDAILLSQDSVWQIFAEKAGFKYELGDGNIIEKTAVDLKALESNYEYLDNMLKKGPVINELFVLLNTSNIKMDMPSLEKLLLIGDTSKANLANNPILQQANQEVSTAQASEKVSRASNFPDLTIGYFIQSIQGEQIVDGAPVIYDGTPRFQGVNLGLSIPLFYGSNKAKKAAAQTNVLIEEQHADFVLKQLEQQLYSATRALMLQNMQVNFYEKAKENANLLIEKATLSYVNGEIDYVEYAAAITASFDIRKKRLSAIKVYNVRVYHIQYLMNAL
ncbi:MAG: cobalt-zinc-cadmium resistance protein CzcA [Crocinitomix sp.]|jgi:cobalt-zinc-cadmium resistance protein CzcA